MGTLDEREKDFERKYEHDQELAFKVKARRNHLLGLWAAGRLGLAGDAAEAYAKEVVNAEIAPHGEEAVVQKLITDLTAKGIATDAVRIGLELDRCAAEARRELGVAD